MNRSIFQGIAATLVIDPAPAEVQIGTGTNNQYYTPVNGYYDYSQYGAILQTSQLTTVAGKPLTGIEFRFQSWTSPYVMPSQTIKLGHIAESVWGNTDYPEIDYSDYTVTDMTAVKSDFTLTIVNDWVRIDFDVPFTYDGTSNLLISWENRDGDWGSGYGGSWHTSSSGLQFARWHQDNGYPTGASSTRSYYYPTVKLHYLD